jgi:AcrR family transcriptional regulator
LVELEGRGTLTRSKRERILDGMLEEVGANGYEATSVRSVLDRTGLYRQAFYDNFADKADCYLQAQDAGIARLESLVRGAALDERAWPDRLRTGMLALLGFLDAEPYVGRALIVEVHPAGPRARERRALAMRRAADCLDRARLEEGAREAPGIASEAVVAGIVAVLHSRLANRDEGSFQRLLPELMYVAVLPFFGPEAAAEELRSTASG